MDPVSSATRLAINFATLCPMVNVCIKYYDWVAVIRLIYAKLAILITCHFVADRLSLNTKQLFPSIQLLSFIPPRYIIKGQKIHLHSFGCVLEEKMNYKEVRKPRMGSPSSDIT